jgi:hypothetical protein
MAAADTTCPRCGEPASVTDGSRKRFRWRIIPAFFLGLYAGLTLTGALFHMSLLFFLTATHRIDSPLGPTTLDAGTLTMSLVTALLWGYAARLWWKGRWWWAIATTVFGYLGGILCLWLFGKL